LNTKEKEFYKPLAEKFAAGYVSWMTNLGMDYTMKRYVKTKAVGDFWFDLAQAVVSNMTRLQEEGK